MTVALMKSIMRQYQTFIVLFLSVVIVVLFGILGYHHGYKSNKAQELPSSLGVQSTYDTVSEQEVLIIIGQDFAPFVRDVTIQREGTALWENQSTDDLRIRIHSESYSFEPDYELLIPPGENASRSFEDPGIYSYEILSAHQLSSPAYWILVD